MVDERGVRLGGGVVGWMRREGGPTRKTERWLSAPGACSALGHGRRMTPAYSIRSMPVDAFGLTKSA